MTSSELPLQLVEFLLPSAVLVWLAVLAIRGSRPRMRRAALLVAALLALTIAQPFGSRISELPAPREEARSTDYPDTEGSLEVGPLGFEYSIYRRDDWYQGGNNPQAELRIETSIIGPVLYHSEKISEMCHGGAAACWGSGSDLPDGDPTALTVTSMGESVLVSLWPFESRGDPTRDAEVAGSDFTSSMSWRVSYGFSSWWGALYWVLAPLLGGLAIRRAHVNGPHAPD